MSRILAKLGLAASLTGATVGAGGAVYQQGRVEAAHALLPCQSNAPEYVERNATMRDEDILVAAAALSGAGASFASRAKKSKATPTPNARS